MEVPFAPVKAVLEALQPLVDRPLRSRSEAHITVISPPEFYQVLRPYVSIEEINTIAQAASIQQTKFTLICVGMAEAVIAGQKQQTYYLVASSPDLVQLRQQIFERYVERGGDRSHFDPAGFYPHVTVGFTLRDLQEGDGVKKGQNSCLYPLTVN
jgi:2'-5' RNA ligase